VAAIHGQVSSALGRAKLPGLWTTESSSFGVDHRLAREFHAVKMAADAP
jgi:hypothetical protein